MDPGPDAVAMRIFEEVLADFAFLFSDPRTPEELPGLTEQAVLACLPIQGPVTGTIALGVPERLALEIAANTLGFEPADPEVPVKARDAVREVASVMGGHLATLLENPGSPATLFPPQVFALDLMDWNRLRTDPSTRCFAVGDHPVLFRVDLKREGSSK